MSRIGTWIKDRLLSGPRWAKRKTVRGLAWLGAGVIAYNAAGYAYARSVQRLPASYVLEVDLSHGVIETMPQNFTSAVEELLVDQNKQVVLHELLMALDKAGRDPRCAGVYARLDGVPGGLAQIQELRDAFREFGRKNKLTMAYADSYSQGSYYLASAFDKVYVSPEGEVDLHGVASQQFFYRDTLDKLKIKPEVIRSDEQKTALNVFTERGFTEPHRRQTEQLLSAVFNQITRDIAGDRGKSVEQLRSLVDEGPFLATDAHKEALVDELRYVDELTDIFKKEAPTKLPVGADASGLAKLESVSLQRFRAAIAAKEGGWLQRRKKRFADKVALIYGVGTVARNEAAPDVMDSKRMMKAFRQAIKDKSVKSIVFRIDSPGGDALASDIIWRQVELAKKAGKPVVVSMGNYAASGGYYAAAPADHIIAQPGTITGSIGVLGGKPVIRGLLTDKLSINIEEIAMGRNALIHSIVDEWTPEQRKKIEQFIKRVAKRFMTVVSTGRNMPMPTVEKIATGQPFSGEEALSLGLVDSLGGVSSAIREAERRVAYIGEPEVVIYPAPKGLFGSVAEAVRGWTDLDTASSRASLLLRPTPAVALVAGALFGQYIPAVGAMRLFLEGRGTQPMLVAPKIDLFSPTKEQ